MGQGRGEGPPQAVVPDHRLRLEAHPPPPLARPHQPVGILTDREGLIERADGRKERPRHCEIGRRRLGE